MKAPKELSMMVQPGDIAVVSAVTVGGKRMKFKKRLRVPVEDIYDCKLNIDHIERPTASR